MGLLLIKILNYKGDLKDISNLVYFRKNIKDFKNANVYLFKPFLDDKTTYYTHRKPLECIKFNPIKNIFKRNNSDRRHVGLFSTAVCLESILSYIDETNNSDELSNIFKGDNVQKIFKFIVRGLSHRLFYNNDKCEECDKYINENILPVTQPTLVSRINILNRFWIFYEKYQEIIINDDSCKEEMPYLSYVIAEIFAEFYDNIYENIDNSHPYIYYKFLRFLKRWKNFIQDKNNCAELLDYFCNDDDFKKFIKHKLSDQKKQSIDKLFIEISKNTNINLFHNIYTHAKYELYRQVALNVSGDTALYDVKRLIYALLTVYAEDKFSSYLIRDKALDLIFEPIKADSNSLWPTGQLINISKDSADSISVAECAYDLLETNIFAPELYKQISNYLPQLTCMFFTILRIAQVDNYGEQKKLKGWYPLNQRDKTENSWISALVMLFIKQYCKLLSYEITKRAQELFKLNYRTTDIKWGDLYDGTSVKSKLRRMYHKNGEKVIVKYKTAMFFGPPGTGKTTLARAVATELGWGYIELTPGDFYAGGEKEILPRINEIFNNLQNLKETVVFIDEIDDLVITRNPEKPYDPRSLYVNTLLPRFQEIHDKGNIILIASTNHIESVDKAIIRLGRFDLIIPVSYMSIHGRISFFFNNISKYYLEKNRNDTQDKDINNYVKENCYKLLQYFVLRTEGFTYIQVDKYFSILKESFNAHVKNDDKKLETLFSNMDALAMAASEFKKETIKPINKDRKIEIHQVDNQNKPTPILTSIRPFDENDFYSLDNINLDKVKLNLIQYTTELFCRLLLLQDQEHKIASSILNSIHDITKTTIHETTIKDIFNKIFTFDVSIECEEKNKCRYALITPFYDSIIDIHKDYNMNEDIQYCYKSLKQAIENRPML
jgi:AAA+ superfamily predicted ATPase